MLRKLLGLFRPSVEMQILSPSEWAEAQGRREHNRVMSDALQADLAAFQVALEARGLRSGLVVLRKVA